MNKRFPYKPEDIDENILPLINEINKHDGIETEHCCAGHDSDKYGLGYVTFYVRDFECLRKFLLKLPNKDVGGAIDDWYTVEADVDKSDERPLRFSIRTGPASELDLKNRWNSMKDSLLSARQSESGSNSSNITHLSF